MAALTAALRDTLDIFDRHSLGTPLTTGEVAASTDVGRRATYDRLDRLAERGFIETKAVGARGRIWWRPPFEPLVIDDGMEVSQAVTDVSFRTLVEAVEEYAIFLLTPDGRVATWNRGAAQIKGYDRDEILGEPLATFYTDAAIDAGIPDRNLTEAAEEGTVEDEGWRVRRDGSLFWASVTITAIQDDAGELAGFAKVTRDQTQRQRYEAELRRERDALETELDDVFERVDDAVVAVDESWRLKFINDEAAAVAGSSIDELLGESVWEIFTEAATGRPRRLAEKAMEEQRRSEFEFHSAHLDTWFEVRLFPSENGLSAYFLDITERKRREHELERYEAIVETVSDGIYIVDDSGRFTLVNEAYTELTGYDRETLLGADVSMVVDQRVAATAQRYEDELVAEDRDTVRFEADVRTAEGNEVRAEATFSLLQTDDGYERVAVVRDVSDRVRRERELERQRERLAALDHLNAIVREVIDAVISRSTQAAIERALCERLAHSDSYEAAWIGHLDRSSQTLEYQMGAGTRGVFDGLTVSTAPASRRSEGIVLRAIQTGAPQVTTDVGALARLDDWSELAEAADIRSAAAIPIIHEDALYGVLSIYASRPDAFSAEEREVVAGLGEVVGHAIAAVERKRALMSDEVVELEFRLSDLRESFGLDAAAAGHITLDQAVALSDDEYLVYGTADAPGVETVQALVEALPHWDDYEVYDRMGESNRVQVKLVEPPVLAVVASHGGRAESVVIEEGTIELRVQLAPGRPTRSVIETIRETYPSADLVSRRQVAASRDVGDGFDSGVLDRLTQGQRTTLLVAYHSGYFERPRWRSGEEIATDLGISAATFHQHLRAGLHQLVEALLGNPGQDSTL